MTKARTNADNASADIQGVTAGTGLTGGGTSGTVTLTNDMATTIAAKGDLVAGTANDAYAALTVGANNTVLTADSSTATGLKWSAISAGMQGLTLLNSGNTSVGTSTSKTWTGLGGYQNLIVYFTGVTTGSLAYFRIEAGNGTSNVSWTWTGLKNVGASTYSANNFNIGGGGGTDFSIGVTDGASVEGFYWLMNANTTGLKFCQAIGGPTSGSASTNQVTRVIQGFESTAGNFAVTQLRIAPNTGSFSGGQVQIWGA